LSLSLFTLTLCGGAVQMPAIDPLIKAQLEAAIVEIEHDAAIQEELNTVEFATQSNENQL
jgi:hypothetical protein